MSTCLACLRPLPTPKDRRRDRAVNGIIWLLILVVGLSLGYLVRDGVFLKRENSSLSGLLNAYVKRVEVDKVVTENVALRAKVRAQRGTEKQGGE